MHWFICQLYANDLPFRQLVKTLDGKTTGPSEYTENIGEQLANCEKHLVCDFDAIDTEMPLLSGEVKNQLSCDQKYLHEIVAAVETQVMFLCELQTYIQVKWIILVDLPRLME